MIIPMLYMMVPTITLFGTLNFYLLFKFNIYIFIYIVLTSYILILISYLMVLIEWVSYL